MLLESVKFRRTERQPKPDGTLIPGAETTCVELQVRGEAGEIPAPICILVQQLAASGCNCCGGLSDSCTLDSECCGEDNICAGGFCATKTQSEIEEAEDEAPSSKLFENRKFVRGMNGGRG